MKKIFIKEKYEKCVVQADVLVAGVVECVHPLGRHRPCDAHHGEVIVADGIHPVLSPHFSAGADDQQGHR